MNEERDDHIREMRATGATYREIAAHSGLSSGRVWQIINVKPPDEPSDLDHLGLPRRITNALMRAGITTETDLRDALRTRGRRYRSWDDRDIMKGVVNLGAIGIAEIEEKLR